MCKGCAELAYLSLYRRYRPNTFAEIVGQRHVVDGLVHALRDDRLAHAYLFTGPRGTGKTSTARILAKAVNCVNGPTPEPCGTCHECDAITRGTSVDVVELDMASHGGVEDARELRERAIFAPATARRKVYILDEVHMASTAAFNALLKLIEEPPGHVLFCMATTDPQKIPATILSRVQRLDLRRVESADVRVHLAAIIQNEGATVTDDALDALIDKGDGSIRDTLTLTEQVIAYSANQITEEAVAAVLGTTPREQLRHTVDALAARDTGRVITLVNDVADAGGDVRQFTHDLIGHLRDVLVVHAAPHRTDLIAATQGWHDVLVSQSHQITADEALYAARALIACLPEQRQRNPRLVLELVLAGIIGDLRQSSDVDLTQAITQLAAPVKTLASQSPVPPVAQAKPKADEQTPVMTEVADEFAAAPSVVTGAEIDAKADWADDGGAVGNQATDDADHSVVSHEAAAAFDSNGAAKADWADDGGAFVDTGTSDGAELSAPTTASFGQGLPTTNVDAGAEGGALQAVGARADGDRPDGSVLGPDASHGYEQAANGGAVDLSVIVARWPGVLEILKLQSRRHHAIFDPAMPVAYSNNVLTVQYSKRHASFHAVQARNAALGAALADACETSFGLRPKLDVRVEGEDIRRRPTPPVVTPADAVVVTEDPDDEREELSNTVNEAAPVDARVVDQILADELDAQPLDGG